MKNLKWKKVGSAVLATALAGSMVLPATAYAQGEIVQLEGGTSTQTNTAPEQVFLNKYSGTVRTQNFNDNWKFYLGDASGAQTPAFDDSSWDQVNLPHDYSIDQKYSQKMEAESGYLPGGTGWYRKNFTVDESLKGKRISIDFGGVYMNATIYVNGKKLGTHPNGYTPFSFDITDNVKFGKENVIAVKVDHQTPSSRFYSGSGIYRDVDFVVTDTVHVDKNGTKIETPDLKDHADGNNVAVKVKTTVVNESENNASVKVKHTIYPKNGTAEQAVGTFETEVATVDKGKSKDVQADFTVSGVKLWSTTTPNLYTVKTEVLMDGTTVDTYETDYGFRYFDFNNNTGFSLNGQKMKLQGVCMHHDQGALGSVANDRSTERQVEILKMMGCNSIRVTHNPASDELIDACNKHGILVIDEAFDGWVAPKNSNSNDYSKWFNKKIEDGNEIMGAAENMTWAQFDLTAMIERGQNDPAIIMWSLGNEMWEGTGGYSDDYKTAQDNLVKWAKAADTTRPVTTGDNKLKSNETGAITLGQELQKAGGIHGMNYSQEWKNHAGKTHYDMIHEAYPEWCMYGSETASAVNSRGIYKGMGSQTDYGDYDLTSYDTSAVGWGATASSAWYEVIKRDFIAGEYVWTGFDYIGEPTPWNGTRQGKPGNASRWPAPKSSYFGIVDTAGLPKDSYYFYQSQWNDSVNTLHILPAWNEEVVYKKSGNDVPVVVYSDAKKVELFFTPASGGEQRSLGAKEFTEKKTTAGYTYQMYEGTGKSNTEHENLYMTWMVPYEAGTITAKAWDKDGKEITENLQGRTSVTTAGEAKKLKVDVDRTKITANGEDLSYLTVSVTDDKGNLVPNADNKVTFEVSGDGVLAGVDNGRPVDHQSYRDDNRKAFSGQLVGIVQSTKSAGTITVKVKAEGMEDQTVTITTTPSSDSSESKKAISSVKMSKSYYVKVGNQPQLPGQVEVVLTDKTKTTGTVTWEKATAEQIGQAGTFSLTGTVSVEGVEKAETVSVNVNMIDTVAALLNYSTTTSVGVAPSLPTSRPAVMEDGTVLTAAFPVKWEAPEKGYDAEGIVNVTGTADVFGESMPVTATVRVQEAEYTVGNNVAKEAMTLSQDIPQEMQSDDLEAIRDGNRTVDGNQGGNTNSTMWSNYKNSKDAKDNDADITFQYATQQIFNQIKIFFRSDSHAASYPADNTTKIYVSETGEEGTWTEVTATESHPEELPAIGVVEYTYDFVPTKAVFVKIHVVNNPDASGKGGGFTCTGIVEAELYLANQADFTTNTTAKLESLKINETSAPAEVLAAGAGSWGTKEVEAKTVEAVGADNAAVTVLPTYENAVRIIIESEDHKTTNTFVVNLDADATDDSKDYDKAKITSTVGSAQSGNEKEKAFDGDTNTLWHTQWNNTNPAERWIEMELEDVQNVIGLRYLPRQNGGQNGIVKTYKIEVKAAEGDEWKEVAVTEGTKVWAVDNTWKMAKFETPVQAKYIRFSGVETHDDQGGNKWMSAAEIRVKVTKEEVVPPTATELSLKAQPTKMAYAVGEKFDPAGLVIGVKYSDGTEKEVAYGQDNAGEFTFNPTLSTALTKDYTKVEVGYAGLKLDVNITVSESEPVIPEALEVVSAPAKTEYEEGEMFNPAGLSVKIKYSDGSYGDEVAYGTANADQFTFNPTLDTALKTSDEKVTVTYAEKTADIKIKVNKKTPVVPENPTVEKVEIKANPAKTEYKEGDKFDPTGLVLTVKYDKGEDKEVAYGDATKADFTFSPSLDTALKTSDEKVTVTYAGKTAEIGIEVKADTPVEPEKPTVDKIAVKKVPAKTTYKAGETFDPSGLVLTVTMSDKTTKEVAYGDETAKDFVFNPTLDTALTEGMNKVDVTYAGKTVDIGIEVKADTPVEPEKPTVEKVEIKANPAKTEYKEGDKFDPTGMSLTVTMSDGTTKVVAYGPETAKDFSFNPSLNTKLTADTKKVTVTYGGQSADVAVSVKADPSEDKKPNTEKPDKGGAVQTGDNFNVTLLIGLVVLAGAVAGGAALTIFKRNKRK